MLQSRNTIEHVLRGLVGFGLLTVAVLYSSRLGWWTLAPLAGALLSFRGCPTCWSVGLVETLLSRRARGSCADGTCCRSSVAHTFEKQP